jgi:hypothetical protein
MGKPFYRKNSEWLNISEEDYLWLDFTIEKTYSALSEAGKKLEKLFVAYLVLLAVAGVLTFSRSLGGSGDFKVPFLDLSLDRRHAAIVVTVLATCELFGLVCTAVYEEVLRWRLEGLILVRYTDASTIGDVPDAHFWYLLYPSLFRMSNFLSASRFSRFIPLLFFYFGLVGLISPWLFGWHIGGDFSWSWREKTFLCIGLSILPLLAFILGVNILRRSQEAAAVYKQLIDHFTTPPQASGGL